MSKRENPAIVTQSFRVPARNVYNHDCAVRFDTTMGFINPLKSFEMNPAERIRVTPSALVRTEPALAPIFGRARCRIYAFWVPYHIYVPNMYSNSKIEKSFLPNLPIVSRLQLQQRNQTSITNDDYAQALGNATVQPNSLCEMLDILPVGFQLPTLFTPSQQTGSPSFKYFEGTTLLATWDIFRNYFADRNRETFPYLYRYVDDTGYLDKFAGFDSNLLGLDDFFANRQYASLLTDSVPEDYAGYFLWEINEYTVDSVQGQNLYDYRHLCCGMPPIKPYMPDINSAFASNSAFEQAIAQSIVRVAEQSGVEGISMQSLLDGQRMYNFLNKVLATGGQLDEMIRAEFGVDVSAELDIPMFLKMWSFDLGFDTIFGTGDESTGEMRGRGLGALGNAKALNFTAKHHGKVMFFMTIEPYVDYYQGVSPFATKTRLTDLFWPSFDRIGWQPLLRSQLNAVDVTTSTFTSSSNSVNFLALDGSYGADPSPFDMQIGVQPAYTEYKGEVNRLHGSFAGGDLFYWTFGRDYNDGAGLNTLFPDLNKAFTTYINPFAFNRSFVDVSEDGMPYLCEVAFNCNIKRVISRNQIENF